MKIEAEAKYEKLNEYVFLPVVEFTIPAQTIRFVSNLHPQTTADQAKNLALVHAISVPKAVSDLLIAIMDPIYYCQEHRISGTLDPKGPSVRKQWVINDHGSYLRYGTCDDLQFTSDRNLAQRFYSFEEALEEVNNILELEPEDDPGSYIEEVETGE